jgi:hypothetical protein
MGPEIGQLVTNIILNDKKIPSFFDKSRLENEKQSSQYYNAQIKYQKTKRLFN